MRVNEDKAVHKVYNGEKRQTKPPAYGRDKIWEEPPSEEYGCGVVTPRTWLNIAVSPWIMSLEPPRRMYPRHVMLLWGNVVFVERDSSRGEVCPFWATFP